MAKATINELSTLISKLQQERAQHLTAIADIDEAFAQLGVTAGKPRKRGRRPGRPKAKAGRVGPVGKKRRKRGTFKTTANDLILSAIKKAGAKGATGAQLTTVWKAAGRTGDAYNTLALLSQAKKIKRYQVAGERGSRYRIGG